ncbi:insulinase family protein [Streptococcus sp. LPB0220]|uniref:EF-P 5-aminopentanol modification-associated protein YfmF n=1 Tax=Streptococcus sp. LPB0220 TaxID=2610896 RepID=UPI001245709E|nr:pitrilysin family protein [Streptococcus sp. LPB0220]QEW10628.1 insulinase family protein [Streptococcus sp. LPB0220]
MELVKGVNLHFLQSKKFKTNKIKVLFSSPLDENTVAARVLVACMMETANQKYPTSQLFREKLASLYGVELSTSVSKRGRVHYVDLNISFVRDDFLSKKNVLTDEVLDIIETIFFSPLVVEDHFDSDTFDVEKKNTISDLESEIEEPYYYAHGQLNQLFFEDETIGMSRLGKVDLARQETAQSSLEQFHQMLQLDNIDFFFIGDFNEVAIVDRVNQFEFKPRDNNLSVTYQQPFTNVVREKLEQKQNQQSILELGYHFSTQYGESLHIPLVVLNGMLGAFSHSRLFQIIREKEGLAYTISSHFDIFTGFMRVFAGIDKESRTKVMTLIMRQLNDLKRGKFTESEFQLTKEMLVNTTLLAQDRQNTLIEREYLKTILGKKVLSLEEWLESIDKVSREEIIEVAKTINLQSVYFMEGK